MNDQELVKRVVAMMTELRGLGGSDKVFIFSPFFKPINIGMDTLFGSLFNFSSWHDFSEDQVKGYKDIVNKYSDILTGFIRIGDSVYKAEADHEYKTLPATKGRELVKALVSRAVKVGRFDLSMMNPGWLNDEEEHKDVNVPAHKMAEAEGEDIVDPGVEEYSNDPAEAVDKALAMLGSLTDNFAYTQEQKEEMIEMISYAPAPYCIEPLASPEQSVMIVAGDNTGIGLYNDDGNLYWEF